tara:strand:- start:444 stop:1127 length:684 start_codon:yes stop_codon:yes gene_type:complete
MKNDDDLPDNVDWIEVAGKEKLATKNYVPGNSVYGEHLQRSSNSEFRIWDPYRSKLAASIINGLKNIPINSGSTILYLGSSTGTTPSHVSDIVGKTGLLFCVEISSRVARDFIDNVVSFRNNIIPIIADARNTDSYTSIFRNIDSVYCDISQPDQTDIAISNCKTFLASNSQLLLVIKSRSIDTTKEPQSIYKQEISKLESNGFEINQMVDLHPFDKDHVLILSTMK